MGFIERATTAALGIALAAAGSLGVSSTASAQNQDFSQVEIETVPVAEDIYMLLGEGGNIGVLVGEDGVFLTIRQEVPRCMRSISVGMKGA